MWEQKIFLSLSSPYLFNLVVYSFCLASVGFNFRYMSLLFAQYSWNVEPEAKRVLQHSSAWICRIVILFIFTLVLQFFLSSTSYSLLIICNCATVSVYISVTAQSHSLFGIHSLYRMDVCSRAHSTICRESTGWKRNGEKKSCEMQRQSQYSILSIIIYLTINGWQTGKELKRATHIEIIIIPAKQQWNEWCWKKDDLMRLQLNNRLK